MITEKILETESGNIHYWITDNIESDKQTLFFLHGLTADHNLFKEQIKYFKEKYNVIAWDAPAHGASRPYRDFSYEKAANAIKQILADNQIKEAVFIGQSLGGYITQSVIKRYPDLVSRFISIDSTPFGEKYYSKSDKWWLDQIEWMTKLYPQKSLKKAIAKQATSTERAYLNMLDILKPYEKNELCHLMAVGYAGFLEDNCDLNITCPILLIMGTKDRLGKVMAYNRQWSETIGVNITWIENAGHNSNDDEPVKVNEAIERFIEDT